jgi:hypothetical protein
MFAKTDHILNIEEPALFNETLARGLEGFRFVNDGDAAKPKTKRPPEGGLCNVCFANRSPLRERPFFTVECRSSARKRGRQNNPRRSVQPLFRQPRQLQNPRQPRSPAGNIQHVSH